jgi:hypothetical protein
MDLQPGNIAQHLRIPNLQLTIAESSSDSVVLEHPVLKERTTWELDEFMKLWEVVGKNT